MSILIEITGSLIEEEIFKQLNRFGWSQIIENGKTYYALFKPIMINGEPVVIGMDFKKSEPGEDGVRRWTTLHGVDYHE